MKNESNELTLGSKAPLEARPESRPTYRPRVDLHEDADAYVLIADVPGADETTVELTVEKNVLKLSARPVAAADATYEYAEFELGAYERVFRLAEDVDTSAIDAIVQNGVVHVRLPRKKPETRSIPVRVG